MDALDERTTPLNRPISRLLLRRIIDPDWNDVRWRILGSAQLMYVHTKRYTFWREYTGTAPTAVHIPVLILHQWKKDQTGIEQDVKLGIIEPVPVGTPTNWCSRMVVNQNWMAQLQRTILLSSPNETNIDTFGPHKDFLRWKMHTRADLTIYSSIWSGKPDESMTAYTGWMQ